MSIDKVKNYISSVRRDFANKPLEDSMVKDNPIDQYALWFQEAISSEVLDPYAACLSTVDDSGQPSSRVVYIRDIINSSFVFYTNYNSKKGKDLLNNSKAAFNVFWGELERQIIIQGVVSKVNKEISDKYFNARPRRSKIGAWASSQSNVLKSRNELENNFIKFEEKFKGDEVPRPSNWGGFSLNPHKIEFWQGRPSRLHDRICYTKEGDLWRKNRLSP
ncbi:MAG: pyridoxamine 5'-phosphate oxidase [Crocinitomicaceae bacterium]|nr:pyridoxamine 5'-phosphate oxidase [Crocinitomicaceae bacterium]|tara:strand:+ start:1524 stop:2180 length:657 start_codon:yes stop_codon:yes gene_type:complete